VRVEDVGAALVLARGRDREVLDREHGRDAPEVAGMADADPPAAPGRRPAARDHVAAGVDAEARRAGGREPGGGAVDRPALDEPRRVEPAGGPDGEEAARAALEREAAREDLVDLGRAVGEPDLAAVEAADGAVRAVGAERRVDLAQPGERGLDVDARAADVDADRHAHDVTDHEGGGWSGGGRHEGRVGPLAGSWLGATWEVARARGARIGRRAGAQ